MKTASLTKQQAIETKDLKTIQQIINPILGEKCWEASLSYGDELCLEIGRRIPYANKLMAGKEKGAWRLGTRATSWKLAYLDKMVASDKLETEEIKRKVMVVEGTSITAFDTSYPKLMFEVGFSNGYKLVLEPDEEEDLNFPYWELFTPQEMLLIVYPGSLWSYLPSNLPMKDS